MKTNTVIVGKTSAGKTRLLNDLIQEGLSVNRFTIENCAEIKIPPNPFSEVVVKIVQAPMDSENE